MRSKRRLAQAHGAGFGEGGVLMGEKQAAGGKPPLVDLMALGAN